MANYSILGHAYKISFYVTFIMEKKSLQYHSTTFDPISPKFLYYDSDSTDSEVTDYDSDPGSSIDYLYETGLQIDELKTFLSEIDLDSEDSRDEIASKFLGTTRYRRRWKKEMRDEMIAVKEITKFLKWVKDGLESKRLTIYSRILWRNKYLLQKFPFMYKKIKPQKWVKRWHSKTIFNGLKCRIEGESDVRRLIENVIIEHGGEIVTEEETHIIFMNVKEEILNEWHDMYDEDRYKELREKRIKENEGKFEDGPKRVNYEWVLNSKDADKALDEIVFPIE